ncbi:MAG: hypothetical protein IJH00_02655 [Erysipelotrichaceae bacterium]|nr:hypothetical protein [Erysipelotrichaceae bacterium]
MYYLIILAVIVQIIGFYRAYKVRSDYQSFSAILTVTSSICIGILTFPYFMMDGDDLFITILHTFKYGISSVGLSVYGDIISTLGMEGPLRTIYTVYLYSLYLIAPISASIFIVSFSRSIVRFFKMIGRRKIHIFSSLDDRSLAIFESICEEEDSTQAAVFCNCDNSYDELENRARSLHGFLIEKDICSYKLNKRKKYEFYVLDDDEQACLNKTSKLCQHLLESKNYVKENVIVRFMVADDNIELIRNLDERYGKDVYLRHIDEYNTLATDILMKHKEVLTSKNRRAIFLFGANSLVKALFNNLLCLLNQPHSSFDIHVFDRDIRSMAESIKANSPEILNLDFERYFSQKLEADARYSVHFHEIDESDPEFPGYVEEIVRPDMIFVCGEDDQRNFTISENLKRLFTYKDGKLRYPKIICLMRSPQLYSMIEDKSIEFFGSYDDIYDYNQLINPQIERAAKRAHLSYLGDDALYKSESEQEKLLDETGFYQFSNQHSSFNVALGLNYHLAYILNQNREDEKGSEFVKRWLSDRFNMASLAECEHQRWNTYQRIQGYRGVSDEQLETMFENYKGGSIKDNNLLLHPALVEYYQLQEREERVDALYNKYGIDRKSKYIQLDKDILRKIMVILEYE